MDSNILLAVVIVAACVAAFFYFQRQSKQNAEHRDTSAAATVGAVTNAISAAREQIRNTTVAAVTRVAGVTAEVAGARQIDPALSSGAFPPSATAMSPPPPASASTAADGAGSPLPAAEPKAPEPAPNPPTPSAPAVVDLSAAPPTEANLTAYGYTNIAIAGEVPGFVAYGMNMQPAPATVLQAFMAWSAAIALRASNLANVQGFKPGGDAFTVNGKSYSAAAIMAKFNSLDPYQQAAALSTDNVVMMAVSVSMGRTPEWANFCSDRMAMGRGIYYTGPGSFDNSSGVLRWYDMNSGAQVATIGPLY